MIELRRFHGFVLVGLCFAAWIVAVNFGLLLAAGPAPAWLVPAQQPTSWNDVEETDRRVAGLIAAARTAALETSKSLALYVGASDARQDIDPGVLTAEEGRGYRYLGLAGTGTSLERLLVISRSFLRTELKPARVVLCTQPVALLGLPTPRAATSLNPLPALRQRKWGDAVSAAESWVWLSFNRTYCDHLVRTWLYRSREEIFRLFNVLDAFSPPEPDPWAAPSQIGFTDRLGTSRLQERLLVWEERGWFNPQEYRRAQGAQAQALIKVIGEFRKRGAQVIVVLMPQRSIVRQRIPPSSKQYLIHALARSFGDSPVSLLDLDSTMPDTAFCDLCHLDDRGRIEFSRLLAQSLRALQCKD
jgi:hypothetical protein